MKKLLIVTTLVFSLVVVPQLTKAATSQELQDMIAALTAQIAQLKAKVGQPQGQVAQSNTVNSGNCFNFDTNLKIGSRGQSVRNLQTLLKEKGHLPAAVEVSGYFGQATAGALYKFQKSQNLPVSKEGQGIFGNMTRKEMNRIFGCSVQNTISNNSISNSVYIPVISVTPITGKISRPFFETKNQYSVHISNAKPNERIFASIQLPDGSIYMDNKNTSDSVDANGVYTDSQIISIPGNVSTGVYKGWVTIGGVKSNVVQFTITEPTSSDVNLNPISATTTVTAMPWCTDPGYGLPARHGEKDGAMIKVIAPENAQASVGDSFKISWESSGLKFGDRIVLGIWGAGSMSVGVYAYDVKEVNYKIPASNFWIQDKKYSICAYVDRNNEKVTMDQKYDSFQLK